jgi:pimeloyl-ACP methyl ester carboxylesterase
MQLKVDGRQVYAATGGRTFDAGKPAIVFLHGAGMDHTVWQLPARSFAWHGHSVLAPDLPGHGRSDGPPLGSVAAMATWAANLLDAAGVRNAALVGHSMGGAIALEAAGAMGERITRVALLGTAAAIPVHRDLLAAAREQPDTAYRMMTAWAFGARAKMGGNPAPGLWMTGSAMALFARNAEGVLFADLDACNAWKTGADAARKLACPALVLLGSQDIMTPARNGRELAGMIASGRTVTIPDCGHMMMAEAPDAVLDALIGFFSQNAAAA